MSRQPAIIVDNVSMKFNLSKEKVDSLKDYIIKSIKKEIKYNEFWALQNVSFTVEKGDRVGILGLNGAGKSTLLKVIAGVFKPTEGSVTKHGKMVPLLELGAGFDPQYTGRENIYLYGAMLGYTKAFIDEKYDETGTEYRVLKLLKEMSNMTLPTLPEVKKLLKMVEPYWGDNNELREDAPEEMKAALAEARRLADEQEEFELNL